MAGRTAVSGGGRSGKDRQANPILDLSLTVTETVSTRVKHEDSEHTGQRLGDGEYTCKRQEDSEYTCQLTWIW